MEPPLPGYYQYFSWSQCVFAQGHNTAEVGIKPPTSRSGVRDSTTRPACSPRTIVYSKVIRCPNIKAFYSIMNCLLIYLLTHRRVGSLGPEVSELPCQPCHNLSATQQLEVLGISHLPAGCFLLCILELCHCAAQNK